MSFKGPVNLAKNLSRLLASAATLFLAGTPSALLAQQYPDDRTPHDILVYAPQCDQEKDDLAKRLRGDPNAHGAGAVSMGVTGEPEPRPSQFENKLPLKYAYVLEAPAKPLAHYCPVESMSGDSRGDPGMQDNTATKWCDMAYAAKAKEDAGKPQPKVTLICPDGTAPVTDEGGLRPKIRGSHDQNAEEPQFLCFALCTDRLVANLSSLQGRADDLQKTVLNRLDDLSKVNSAPEAAATKNGAAGKQDTPKK